MVIPYKGRMGENVMKRLKTFIRNSFTNTKVLISYKGTKLSTMFNTKDQIKKEHKHDIIYHAKCPDCTDDYIGETARRLIRRVDEHTGKDNNSHLTKHSQIKGHKPVSLEDFKIIGSHFKNQEYFRKIAEAIYIKRFKPTLNVQHMSIPIELFN